MKRIMSVVAGLLSEILFAAGTVVIGLLVAFFVGGA